MGDVHGIRLVSDLGQEDIAGDDTGTSAVVSSCQPVRVSFFLFKLIIKLLFYLSRSSLLHIEPKEFEGQTPLFVASVFFSHASVNSTSLNST